MKKKSLLSKGYITFENFLSNKEKVELYNLFVSSLNNFGIKIEKSKKFFEDEKLHKSLINFRSRNKKKFGEFYDYLNLNAKFKSFFFSKNFFSKYEKILKKEKENIFINGFMFRMDFPFDKRNVLDWHQDSPYYQMSYPKFNSYVALISITNNNIENGAMLYIPKSHKKFFKIKSVKKSRQHSENFKIKISAKEMKRIKCLETNFGDLSFFHTNIKHRSGKNLTNKVRITIGCRIHDMTSDFKIGKEIYIFNKTGRNSYLN
tara:strand:- start:5231 stop:6013 length:783 start_codon:yes stop_codon:yes gene_type:complete